MAATAKILNLEPPALEALISEGRMEIGPDLAARVIAERVYERQRPAEAYHVRYLADMLRRGELQPGRQIWFGLLDGRLHLIDGQHRLRALIEAGLPLGFQVEFLAVADTDELHEAYITFDRIGRPRSLSEMLASLGIAEKHELGKQVATSVFRAAFLLHYSFEPPHYMDDPIAVRSDKERLTYAEPYWAVARDYEKIITGAPAITRRRLRSPQVMAVGLITLLHQPEMAKLFWTGLADNDGLRKHDPRHTLLTWLNGNAFGNGAGVPTGAVATALAWNAFFAHRTIETLKVGSVVSIRIAGTPIKGKAR